MRYGGTHSGTERNKMVQMHMIFQEQNPIILLVIDSALLAFTHCRWLVIPDPQIQRHA